MSGGGGVGVILFCLFLDFLYNNCYITFIIKIGKVRQERQDTGSYLAGWPGSGPSFSWGGGYMGDIGYALV